MEKAISDQLLEFIEKSPTCFHTVYTLKNMLNADGFKGLQESQIWDIKAGGKYYVTRNGSSLIAFVVPETVSGFHIVASHSDSPTFKVKEIPELSTANKYTKINVEGYGGMIMSTWFDRPLSVAGRVMVRTENDVETRLVNVDQDLLMSPSVAIHMNRGVNDGYKYNVQKDLLPLYGTGNAKDTFMKCIAEAVGAAEDAILGKDLYLYPRTKGCIWGAEQEFISSPRLDDLQSAFASIQGLVKAEHHGQVSMIAVLDNEEVGSSTKQGADSDFLKETVFRICKECGLDEIERRRAMASSFMVSADNAHAAHPNAMEKADEMNRPFMNEGVVIKYNGNQKYTSDAVSSAIFKMICERAGVPCQTFMNRSDMAGGSTLGNISNTQLSMNTVDIGLAQLAMHSAYETAGVKDTVFMINALKTFFESKIVCVEDGRYSLE